MATTPRTRRKATPATDTDTGAAVAAAVADPAPVTPAPATARRSAAAKAPARKAAAGKTASAKTAPAPAAPAAPKRGKKAAAAPSAEQPEAKRPAAKPSAKKTRPTKAAAVVEAAAPAPALAQAPAQAAAQPATPPATKGARKTAAPARTRPVDRPVAPAAAPAAAPVEASVDVPAVAAPAAVVEPPSTRAKPAPRPAAKAARPAARKPTRSGRPAPAAAPDSSPAAPAPLATPPAGDPAADTAQAVLAVLAAAPVPADAPVAASVAPAPRAERPPRPDRAPPAPRAEPVTPTGPAHSSISLVDGDQRQLAWHPGHACPPALRQAASQRLDAQGHLPPEDDGALPTLLRIAADTGHLLQVDEAVWAHLAAHRDARTRAAVLATAYPDGPASAALQTLLRAPLPLFQAEGALFAVIAGRALIADDRGLGKGVQAIAAATLWQRHFGVRRVLVLCAPAQRTVWQRAWQRFAGQAAQVMEGGLHHRQSLWSGEAAVRILSPEALASDAAHLAHWAPDLVIVDEPQQLGLDDAAWPLLAAPQALVLCGAPLAEQPALMQALVAWLDAQRLGPLAALHELQAAADGGLALADDDVERLSAQLSRLMLQRQRDDVADQLPALVHSERLLTLAPGQRQAHDQALALARRLLDGWLHSAYLSDSDQWRLALALRDMQRACHRADPADPASALADASVQALLAQRDEWASTGPLRAAVLCASEADRAQLARRLADPGGADAGVDLQLLLPGEALPAGLDAVLQFGTPWKPRRNPAGPRGEAVPGQQWVYLVAQDSLDAGLFDTLAQRLEVPRGLGDGGGRDYLDGERLADWLQALQAAVLAAQAAPAPR